jgi:cytochrome c553
MLALRPTVGLASPDRGIQTGAAQDMVNHRIPIMFGALMALAAPLAALAQGAEAVEAKLQICSSCHGGNGEPINVTTPIIWGQQEYFLVKQLHDFKTHDRDSSIMAPMAQLLTQQELRPAAAYFAKKSWPARRTTVAATSPPQGMERCQICHQPNFVGGLPAPRLAGQSYEYLVEAMRGFADGERTNNVDMAKIMQDYSAAERETMARYLSGL